MQLICNEKFELKLYYTPEILKAKNAQRRKKSEYTEWQALLEKETLQQVSKLLNVSRLTISDHLHNKTQMIGNCVPDDTYISKFCFLNIKGTLETTTGK